MQVQRAIPTAVAPEMPALVRKIAHLEPEK
jgi:hypothetical protein